MQKLIFPIITATLMGLAGAAESWSTNPDEAMKQAATQNKGVLLEFTGSDWCGACIIQKKEALSKPEVLEKIAVSFIPVELDFPRKKEQDAQTKKLLTGYKESYGIHAFPTLIFTDEKGRPVHSVLGYSNPAQVLSDIAKAEQALKTQQRLQKSLPLAKSKEESKKLTVELLRTVPQPFLRQFYQPELKDLVALDPEDTSGIIAGLNRMDKLKDQQEEWAKTMREEDLFPMSRNQPDEALTFLNNYLKKDDLLPEIKQALLAFKARILIQQNRMNEVEQPLQEAIAMNTNSQDEQLCKNFLKALPEMKKERANLKPGEQPPLPPGAIPAAKLMGPPPANKAAKD